MEKPCSLPHPLSFLLAITIILVSITFINTKTTIVSCSSNNKNMSNNHIDISTPSNLTSLDHTHMNIIDACWRNNPNWADDRMTLANCVVGFGSHAKGGQGGDYYVVSDPSDDDPANPTLGTLRHAITRLTPLWIYFAHDMNITLQNELIFTSDKTLDGRGTNVHISHGPCFTIQNVSNVIIHGLHIHNCTHGTPGRVMTSSTHVGFRQGSDGDGISVFASKDIWIDHNYFASCYDGLVDVVHASTRVTISNNLFVNHDKVMLLGHNDAFVDDKAMQVTIIFNRFGPGLVQRMPRCRFGFCHVVNNDYYEWSMYAIGGSANPTIISQGNRFLAASKKEVTKRESQGNWTEWAWRSLDDTFLNGAYFVQSGTLINVERQYGLIGSRTFAPFMTSNAGPLDCLVGRSC